MWRPFRQGRLGVSRLSLTFWTLTAQLSGLKGGITHNAFIDMEVCFSLKERKKEIWHMERVSLKKSTLSSCWEPLWLGWAHASSVSVIFQTSHSPNKPVTMADSAKPQNRLSVKGINVSVNDMSSHFRNTVRIGFILSAKSLFNTVTHMTVFISSLLCSELYWNECYWYNPAQASVQYAGIDLTNCSNCKFLKWHFYVIFWALFEITNHTFI